MSFFDIGTEAVVIRLRVTPNARVETIEGPMVDGAGVESLRVRVRAVPEKGKANAAVIALLAKALGVPKSAILLVSGDTGRDKRVRIVSPSPDLIARLAALAGAGA